MKDQRKKRMHENNWMRNFQKQKTKKPAKRKLNI